MTRCAYHCGKNWCETLEGLNKDFTISIHVNYTSFCSNCKFGMWPVFNNRSVWENNILINEYLVWNTIYIVHEDNIHLAGRQRCWDDAEMYKVELQIKHGKCTLTNEIITTQASVCSAPKNTVKQIVYQIKQKDFMHYALQCCRYTGADDTEEALQHIPRYFDEPLWRKNRKEANVSHEIRKKREVNEP